MKEKRPEAPAECPVCAEEVPRGSLACPNCGADHNSGWREDANSYDGVDLPEEKFNYDEFVQAEFGPGFKPRGIKTIWWITALILLLVSLALYFFTV